MRSTRTGALALLPFIITGCALLAHGTTQEVVVRCDVPGATVTVDGRVVEPGTVTLSRDEDHVIRAEALDHAPMQVHVRPRLSRPWAVLDGLLAGAGACVYGAGVLVTGWPLLIDYLTGALYELETTSVALTPAPAASPWVEARAVGVPEAGGYCTACGAALPPRGQFCGHCGKNRDALPPR